MTQGTDIDIVSGAEIEIPLNKLKKSPRNARKTPHSAEAVEALAASIAAKKMLQKPVVEPERDDGGAMTGFWLVTIGEGRRLALELLARRKTIKNSHPVACMIDVEHDPQEISLDENVTRSAMHPADQFEAFRDLHERKGYGAEEIAARFGVSPGLVRQRLRLANLSPRLIDLYRAEDLGLDQLMAFAVTDDRARQEQVYEQLSYNRSPAYIRAALTTAKVAASDRRAQFVGAEAYVEAGGTLTRDLFTDDRGGWLDDVALLDALVMQKLAALAEELRADEGWKWGEAHLDYPTGHGFARVYPHQVERSAEDAAQIEALSAEYDGLVERFADLDELPPDAEARLKEIDTALEAFGEPYAYDVDEIARGGLFVMLGHDGQARIERGFIRPADAAPPPESEEDALGDDGETIYDPPSDELDQDEDDGEGAPLPDRLIAELTAYRTASLRDALAEHPDVAQIALLHALVLATFFPGSGATCLDVRLTSRGLEAEAPQIDDGPAARRIAARHETWARQMPQDAALVWAFVLDLDSDSRASLLAHCVALTADAVRGWRGRALALRHADALAASVGLSMTGDWRADARRYLGRVTKAQIVQAVREAAGSEAAERLAGLRKPELIEAAEPLVLEAGWLPILLRACEASGEPQTAPDLAA
ncbi:chromosome partitioning protein ParB [Phenylobacterium sp. Root77]|uniref:ParB/RepB/Spo0J family partition protein n=1 Tax=unclassified Phenylobacterium TaxID=2640670 RepID=UPI0006F60939|nr:MULTISPECIES: ParB/RepB/Spo0J family partition protein [unclassified Phenylobacterium]KQW72239.1 chromosome partitioning protein ParB [Phenylobacterium sp. Root1277]KQW95158.1 chromosome partitioning protein ParB [Phenylobacterium sp. Root1290]KRC44851.1 chromosome partitioning protein ParB [Phenylobacterium sp. Root77]